MRDPSSCFALLLVTDLQMHRSKLITFLFLILELERLMALSNEIKNPSKYRSPCFIHGFSKGGRDFTRLRVTHLAEVSAYVIETYLSVPNPSKLSRKGHLTRSPLNLWPWPESHKELIMHDFHVFLLRSQGILHGFFKCLGPGAGVLWSGADYLRRIYSPLTWFLFLL